MCEWGNTVAMELDIGKHLSHTGEEYMKLVDVDECIADLVLALNTSGFKTVASCCGHGKQPGRISLLDGKEILLTDYDTAQKISHAFSPIN